MATHHRSPGRAIERRTEPAPNGTAWQTPVLGIVLTTVGLLLVIAGLVEMPAPATLLRLGWLHSQDGGELAMMTHSATIRRRAWPHRRVMALSAMENTKFGDRWATSSSQTREDQNASARVTADPILGTAAEHVGTAASGSGIISADLQLPRGLGRNCRRTPADSAHEAARPLCRDARARQGEDISNAVYCTTARPVG